MKKNQGKEICYNNSTAEESNDMENHHQSIYQFNQEECFNPKFSKFEKFGIKISLVRKISSNILLYLKIQNSLHTTLTEHKKRPLKPSNFQGHMYIYFFKLKLEHREKSQNTS